MEIHGGGFHLAVERKQLMVTMTIFRANLEELENYRWENECISLSVLSVALPMAELNPGLSLANHMCGLLKTK